MKKFSYFIMTLAIAGTLFSACKKKKDDTTPSNNGGGGAPTSRTLWMTSFEGNQTGTVADSTNSIFTGSYSYAFGTNDAPGKRVKKGTSGVPATSVSGDSIFMMKTTAAGAYYGGGFGWNPGSGNSFDTLDINDAFEFSFNFNGNANTNLKLQLVETGQANPADNDVFIYTINNINPSGGWQKASVTLNSFTWDQYDPANTTGTHDKMIDVSKISDFKFIYFNNTGGLDLEVYIDDIKIVDNNGGDKVLNGN